MSTARDVVNRIIHEDDTSVDAPQPYLDWLLKRRDPAQLEKISFGVSISVSGQEAIEERAAELGIELIDVVWERLNADAGVIERNLTKYLARIGIQFRSEGHDSNGDLIGSAWITDQDSSKAEEAVKLVLDVVDTEPKSTSSGTLSNFDVYAGVGPSGQSLLDVTLSFFGTEQLQSWYAGAEPVAEALPAGESSPYRCLLSENSVYAVDENDKMAGILWFRPAGKRTVELEHVEVEPAHAKRGVGTLLLRRFLQEARQRLPEAQFISADATSQGIARLLRRVIGPVLEVNRGGDVNSLPEQSPSDWRTTNNRAVLRFKLTESLPEDDPALVLKAYQNPLLADTLAKLGFSTTPGDQLPAVTKGEAVSEQMQKAYVATNGMIYALRLMFYPDAVIFYVDDEGILAFAATYRPKTVLHLARILRDVDRVMQQAAEASLSPQEQIDAIERVVHFYR